MSSNFRFFSFEDLGPELSYDTKLLNIWACSFKPGGLVKLVETLKVSSILTYLELKKLNINTEDASHLSSGLETSTSLRELWISETKNPVSYGRIIRANTGLENFQISKEKLGPETCSDLAEALKVNNTLARLSLDKVELCCLGLERLSEGLKLNTGLTSLKLAPLQIQTRGLRALGSFLQINQTLTELSLPESKLGAISLEPLLTALCQNSSLTHLDLSNNQIKSDNAVRIALFLKSDGCRLVSLDVSSNQIDKAGLTTLAESLKVNTSLTGLRVGNCPEITRAYIDSLQVNGQITQIDLYNGIDPILRRNIWNRGMRSAELFQILLKVV